MCPCASENQFMHTHGVGGRVKSGDKLEAISLISGTLLLSKGNNSVSETYKNSASIFSTLKFHMERSTSCHLQASLVFQSIWYVISHAVLCLLPWVGVAG